MLSDGGGLLMIFNQLRTLNRTANLIEQTEAHVIVLFRLFGLLFFLFFFLFGTACYPIWSTFVNQDCSLGPQVETGLKSCGNGGREREEKSVIYVVTKDLKVNRKSK